MVRKLRLFAVWAAILTLPAMAVIAQEEGEPCQLDLLRNLPNGRFGVHAIQASTEYFFSVDPEPETANPVSLVLELTESSMGGGLETYDWDQRGNRLTYLNPMSICFFGGPGMTPQVSPIVVSDVADACLADLAVLILRENGELLTPYKDENTGAVLTRVVAEDVTALHCLSDGAYVKMTRWDEGKAAAIALDYQDGYTTFIFTLEGEEGRTLTLKDPDEIPYVFILDDVGEKLDLSPDLDLAYLGADQTLWVHPWNDTALDMERGTQVTDQPVSEFLWAGAGGEYLVYIQGGQLFITSQEDDSEGVRNLTDLVCER